MKSHVRVLTDLAAVILKDAAAKSAVDASEVRLDLMTIRSRVEHEGLSFFTITLPSIGEDLEFSLRDGSIAPTYFRSFRKYGKVPAFLRGFFERVFDKRTGNLLTDPCVSSVEALRQIAYAFKKIKMPCTPQRVVKALEGYVESEQVFEEPIPTQDIADFDAVSQVLWNEVFRDEPNIMELVPKHGPGATAEKLSGNQKFNLRRWHDRLEPYFPIDANAISSFGEESIVEGLKDVSIIPEQDEMPVRVITVPKTLKKPRIIAIEPVCMQYTQQAIKGWLYTRLESHRLTKGHVNFTDQKINRRLAMESSKTERFATLDLSAASDRVPLSLVPCMFKSSPELLGAILACRSKTAQMPDGRVIRLKKFASMGSALCFPIEAMYFYTICIVGLLKKRELPVTLRNVQSVSRDVYVYGDDILVPTHEAAFVARTLHKYFCKVNATKSFWTGRFRESCGMDAFDGEDVTPVYIRSLPPSDKRSQSSLVSWVATRNLFYVKGYWQTARFIEKRVSKILGHLPVVSPKSEALGTWSFSGLVDVHRISKRYHRPEVKAWVPQPVYRADRLTDYGALLKCLVKLEDPAYAESSRDARHLDRTARHGAVALKLRWTTPY